MAFKKHIFYDFKTLLLVLIGIPWIASTNIDCGGKPFRCLNSTHFMICVVLGEGVSSTVDDNVIHCPPPTECDENNRFECALPVRAPPPPLPSLVLPIVVNNELETTTEEFLVDTISMDTGVEQHLELSTINATQEPITESAVIPLQPDILNEITTTINIFSYTTTIPPEVLQDTTVVDQSDIFSATEIDLKTITDLKTTKYTGTENGNEMNVTNVATVSVTEINQTKTDVSNIDTLSSNTEDVINATIDIVLTTVSSTLSGSEDIVTKTNTVGDFTNYDTTTTVTEPNTVAMTTLGTNEHNNIISTQLTTTISANISNDGLEISNLQDSEGKTSRTTIGPSSFSTTIEEVYKNSPKLVSIDNVTLTPFKNAAGVENLNDTSSFITEASLVTTEAVDNEIITMTSGVTTYDMGGSEKISTIYVTAKSTIPDVTVENMQFSVTQQLLVENSETTLASTTVHLKSNENYSTDNVIPTVNDVDIGSLKGSRSSVSENVIVTEIDFKTTIIPEVTEACTDYNTMLPTTVANVIADQFLQNKPQIVDSPQNKIDTTKEHSNAIPITHPNEKHNPNFNLTDETTTLEIDFSTTAGSGEEDVTLQENVIKNTKPNMISDRYLENSTEKSTGYQNNITATNNDEISTASNKIVSGTINPIEQKVPITLKPDLFVNQKLENINDTLPTNQVAISTVDTVIDFTRLNESDNSETENSTTLSTKQTISVTTTPSVLVHQISENGVIKSTENPTLIEKALKIDINLLKETSETLTTFDGYGRTNVINNLGSTESTKTITDHAVTFTENETTTDIIQEQTTWNDDTTKKTSDIISTTLGNYGTTNITYTLIPTEASATITDKTFVVLRNETTSVRIPDISISENLINSSRLNESDNTQTENSTVLSTEQADSVTAQRVVIYQQSENSIKTLSDNALQIETNPEVDEDLGDIKNTWETSITFQGYRRANETYNLVSTDAIKTITEQTFDIIGNETATVKIPVVSPTENVIDITKQESYKAEMENNTNFLIEPIITVATTTIVIERQQLENSAITSTENSILIETTPELVVDKLKETSESLTIFDDYERTNVTYTSGYIEIGTIGNETATHKIPVISPNEIVINNETENSTVFFIQPIIALDASNVIEHQQLGNSTITSTGNPILIETIPQVDVNNLMETSETLTTFDSYGRTNVTYNLASAEAIKTITDHTVIGDESATDRMPEKATSNDDMTVSNMQTVNLKPSMNNETDDTVLLIMENDTVTITILENGMDSDNKTETSFKGQIFTEKPLDDEAKTESSKVVITKPEVFALPVQSIIQTKNATFATAVNNITTEPNLHTITESDIEADNLTNIEVLTAKIMRITDTFVETTTPSNTTNNSDFTLTTVTSPIKKQATSGVSETETATQTVFSLSTENPEASLEPLLETAPNHNIAYRNDNLFIIKNQLSTTSAFSHELSKSTEPVETTLQGGNQQLFENAPVAMLIADTNMQNKTSTTLQSYSVASSIKQLPTTRDMSNMKEIQNNMTTETNEEIDKSYGNITELTSKPNNLSNSTNQEKVINSNILKAPESVGENPIENILFNETVSTIVWVADGVVTILNDQNVKSIGTANKQVETTAGKTNNFTPEPSVFSDTTKIVVPAIIASQGIKLLGGQPSMETVGNENNFTELEDKFHSGNVTELLLETENSKKSKNTFDITPAMNEKDKISNMNDNINGVSQNLVVSTTPIATLQKTYASISLPSLGLEPITYQYIDQTIERKLVSSRNQAQEVKTKEDINFVLTVSTRNNTAADNNLGDYFTANPGTETAIDKVTTSISENVGTNSQDYNEALLSLTSEVTNSAVSEVETSTNDLLKGSHYSSIVQNTKNTDNVVIGSSTEKINSIKQPGSLALPESGLIGVMLPSIEHTTTSDKVLQATVLEHIRKETLAAHENTEIITESLSLVNSHTDNEQKSQDDIAKLYMNRQPIPSTGVPQYFSLNYPEQSTTTSNLMQAGGATEVHQPLATRVTNERPATGVTNEWTATETTDNELQTQSDQHEQTVTIPLSTLQSSTAASLTVSTTTNTQESISTRPLQFDCESRPTGRYADIDDCRKFYICSGIPNPIVGLCPGNTVFSDINKQCTKNLSHCVRQTEFKCVSQGRFSDLIKPNIYHICVKNGKLFLNYKLQCQQGYFLNKATVRCYKIPEPSPPTIESKSQSAIENKYQAQEKGVNRNIENNENESECEEEGRFADPYNCRGYYICKATKKSDPEYRRRYKKCDSDEVFDREKKTCVDASSYECSYCDSLNPNIYYVNVKRGHHQLKFKLQCRRGYNLNKTTVKCHKEPESSSSQSKSENNSSNETSSQDKEIDRSNSSHRRNKYKFECIEEGKFSDPNNCRKYYKCKLKNKSSVSYRRKHKKCDENEVFHKEKQKCVDTSEYKCL